MRRIRILLLATLLGGVPAWAQEAADPQGLADVQALIQAQQYSAAQSALEALPQALRESLAAMNLRGQLAAQSGDLEAASQWYERILEQIPEARVAFHNLQTLYQARAAKAYRQALAEPEQPEPRLDLQASPSLLSPEQHNYSWQQPAPEPRDDPPAAVTSEAPSVSTPEGKADGAEPAVPISAALARPIYDVQRAPPSPLEQHLSLVRNLDIQEIPASAKSDEAPALGREEQDMLQLLMAPNGEAPE